MSPSIKRYLLANLLVGVQLATLLAVLSNLYLGYKSVRPHLDAQMVVMAYTINTFLAEDINNEVILNKLHQKTAEYVYAIQDVRYDDISYLDDLHTSLDNIQFRVYAADGHLIAASPSAPTLPALGKTGFYNIKHLKKNWRVFNLHNHSKERIVIMQPHDIRLFIEKNANIRAIVVILLTIPPLGIFIWIVIGRSLKSIIQTCYEIRQRAHNNLEPIPTNAIPIEIMPLIQELNNLFTRLQDNFLREKRFAGDAAHELKTPLAALKTHAQVAEKIDNIKGMRAELRKVIEGVNRASHTVDQLLILSRTMPDAYMHEHVLLSLSDVITSCVAELVPDAISKNITLSYDNETNDDRIFGHYSALSILVRNIVDNAIRYSFTDSKVAIRLYNIDNHVMLEVMDQGPGIPADSRDRVFERFYRVVGNEQNGTGLGLNIVDQIARLHQAKVSLLDNEQNGHGLVVRVLFAKTSTTDLVS